MLYLLFFALTVALIFYYKEHSKQWDYLLVGLAFVFLFLEAMLWTNSDVYNKLLYTEVQNCSYNYIPNTTLLNTSSCSTYYDLNVNRTESIFQVPIYVYMKGFDVMLFDHLPDLFYLAAFVLVFYIAYRSLKDFRLIQ